MDIISWNYLLLAGVVLLIVGFIPALALIPSAGAATTALVGSGSSYAGLVMLKWAAEVVQSPNDLNINYTPSSSSNGVSCLTSMSCASTSDCVAIGHGRYVRNGGTFFLCSGTQGHRCQPELRRDGGWTMLSRAAA
jgi:hypothetical protein